MLNLPWNLRFVVVVVDPIYVFLKGFHSFLCVAIGDSSIPERFFNCGFCTDKQRQDFNCWSCGCCNCSQTKEIILHHSPQGIIKSEIPWVSVWQFFNNMRNFDYMKPKLMCHHFGQFILYMWAIMLWFLWFYSDAFGDSNVGLLTGDSAINKDAQVLIMTTEILRNMLYQRCALCESFHLPNVVKIGYFLHINYFDHQTKARGFWV